MQQFLEFLSSLEERFGDDEDAIKLIDRQMRYTNEWIGENTPEEPEKSPRAWKSRSVGEAAKHAQYLR